MFLLMQLMLDLAGRIRREERAASMVEYGLLVALIAVVAVLAVKYFGGQVSSSFSNSGTNL